MIFSDCLCILLMINTYIFIKRINLNLFSLKLMNHIKYINNNILCCLISLQLNTINVDRSLINFFFFVIRDLEFKLRCRKNVDFPAA